MAGGTPRAAPPGWLARGSGLGFVLFASLTAFTTYFCMYAFRKPFSAAKFADAALLWGFELKTVLVASQTIGYAISKFAGIKICSEMPRARRVRALVFLVVVAEIALVLFAVLPEQYKWVALFCNGLPLGMVWGLVVWYLEGRRTADVLLAALSCSFIVASGAVKDVGRWTMRDLGVSEWWMPAVVGGMFLPLYLLAAWLLNRMPDPNVADREARVDREPMDAKNRRQFLIRLFPGLVALFATYVMLTAYRDFRDFYGVEMFQVLGYEDEPAIFTFTETLVALAVLVVVGVLVVIRDNRYGLFAIYVIMVVGVLLTATATWMLSAGQISGFWWMTLVGLGAYLTYVPYNSVLFERLVATTGVVSTAVFTIYVADALGYAGSLILQFSRDRLFGDISRLEFFKGFSYALAGVGAVLLVFSCAYFLMRPRVTPSSSQPEP